METQICTKCKLNKSFVEFSKGSNKTGLNSRCKICISEYQKIYREKNKEKIKNYYLNNKEKLDNRSKKYQEDNKEKLDLYRKQYRKKNKEKAKNWWKENKNKIRKWREENKEKIKEKAKKYREKNREKIKIRRQLNKHKINKRQKERRESEPLFKLKSNLRTRIHSLMVGKYKKNLSTEKLLGVPFKEVKEHIEQQFVNGMSWENYGACKGNNCNEVWHIDHIIPLSSAKTQEEIEKLFHFTNLQPLWAIDNIIKSDNL